jgi:hypothetical protein
MKPAPKLTGLSLAVFAVCTSTAFTAPAQQAASPPAAPASAPEKQSLDLVAVSGFRRSLEDALNTKRNADGFVDAISSDGLGRFLVIYEDEDSDCGAVNASMMAPGGQA